MDSVSISTDYNRGCLSYNIPGAGSFNLANCYESCTDDMGITQCSYEQCYCLFFTESGCSGTAAYVGVDSNGNALAGNNCADTGETYQEPVAIKFWWG